MDKELYFDIVSDEWAGGLYRIKDPDGNVKFYYHRSTADLEDEDGKTSVTESYFDNFINFWKQFSSGTRWFTFHPLFIHPEQRPFITKELKTVNWNLVMDEKWRIMYQRQWNKTLNSAAEYYKPLRPQA